MRVVFLETVTVQAVDGETYVKGQVYDLPDTSAERWLRRGTAVLESDAPPPGVNDEKNEGKENAGQEEGGEGETGSEGDGASVPSGGDADPAVPTAGTTAES